ncbi:hypothetical protein [Rhizobium halophilum]|uniref:hypothetical protein n=1 Tax=Rhizobium halophilum TaxID=2846852 RepID=UPI0021D45DA3|nr:hypothetical protein [Rhizobium halophilum]
MQLSSEKLVLAPAEQSFRRRVGKQGAAVSIDKKDGVDRIVGDEAGKTRLVAKPSSVT